MAGPRHPQREMASKEKVSITLDRDVFDFIEHGIRMRWWLNRSQAVAMMGFAFMRNQQAMQQGNPQVPRNPQNFGRLPP